MIEDYAYEGADFHKDLEIPLPKGEEWDDWGKKGIIHHVFNFLDLFNFYFVILRQVKMVFANVGPFHLARMSRIERREGVRLEQILEVKQTNFIVVKSLLTKESEL